MIRPATAAVLLTEPDVAARIIGDAIEDALARAEPAYWRRRARGLEQVGTIWADEVAKTAQRHAWFLEAERRGISILDVLEEEGLL